MAVPIQVAGPDPFGVVLVRESLTIEGVDDVVLGLGVPERAGLIQAASDAKKARNTWRGCSFFTSALPGVRMSPLHNSMRSLVPFSASRRTPESPDKRIQREWIFRQESAVIHTARRLVRQVRSMS